MSGMWITCALCGEQHACTGNAVFALGGNEPTTARASMMREQAIDEATKVWRRADITTGGSIIQILEKLGLVRFKASRKDFLTVLAEHLLPATSYTLPNLQTDSDGRAHRRGQAPTRWSSTQGRPLGLVNIERQAHALRAKAPAGVSDPPPTPPIS